MTRRLTRLLPLLALALLALATSSALAVRPARSAPVAPSTSAAIASATVTDTVVVAFRPGADTAKVKSRHKGQVSSVAGAKRGSRTRRVKLTTGTSLSSSIAELSKDPDVLWAEPLVEYRAMGLTPDDPLYFSQWGLPAIDAPAAWASETGATHPITIAVVDTGID